MLENHKLILIYIILESRISIKDASVLFNVPIEELENLVDDTTINRRITNALRYLFNHESTIDDVYDAKRAHLIAVYLYKRYLRILKIADTNERKCLLKKFCDEIMDVKIEEIKKKKGYNLSEDEKIFVLRFKLKYAFTEREFDECVGYYRTSIKVWANELASPLLKKRLDALSDYNKSLFDSYVKRKR